MPRGAKVSTEQKLTIRELLEKGMSRNEAYLCYRFRQARIKLQLSQTNFAGALNTGLGSIKHIEAGRRPPNIDEIILLHKVFKLSFEWILLGTETSERQKK